MERVLEARARYDQARKDAVAAVARARAALGYEIAMARKEDTSQTAILKGMKKSRQQVRTFELAWEQWAEKHPGEDPREAPGTS